MDFNSKVILGQTGLLVGRLGISSSYGAHAEAFEEAFERGCNYFTWGTFLKGPSSEMKTAIRNIVHSCGYLYDGSKKYGNDEREPGYSGSWTNE